MNSVKCPMCYGDGYFCDVIVKLCDFCNGTGEVPKKKRKAYDKRYGLKLEPRDFKRRQLIAKLNLIERLRVWIRDWIGYRKFLKETY